MRTSIRSPLSLKAVRIILGFVTLGLALWAVSWTASEYQTSARELSVATRVVEKGGYILRRARTIDELVETTTQYIDKPVLLGLAETRLARLTHDKLGFRIQRAIFVEEDTTDYAVILRQSTSLTTVEFAGPRNGQAGPPLTTVEAFRGRFLQRVEFYRYNLTAREIGQLRQSLNTASIVFGVCSFPSNALAHICFVRGLKEVQIINCNIDGSDQSITNSIESLRSAGIEVIYQE
jgi:hypothetical protein